MTGETITRNSAIKSEEVRLNIAAKSFWVPGQKAFFDVKVFNPLTRRYGNTKIPKACEMNEKKRRDNKTNVF